MINLQRVRFNETVGCSPHVKFLAGSNTLPDRLSSWLIFFRLRCKELRAARLTIQVTVVAEALWHRSTHTYPGQKHTFNLSLFSNNGVMESNLLLNGIKIKMLWMKAAVRTKSECWTDHSERLSPQRVQSWRNVALDCSKQGMSQHKSIKKLEETGSRRHIDFR